VLKHLHVSIGFKSFHLRSVPHLLTNDLRKNGRSMQAPYCHSCMLCNVMAGIILWLMMSPGFLQCITMSDVDSVDRWCGHRTETWYSEQKFMFTMIWNPSGFYVVDRFLNAIKMNSEYFVTNILTSLEQTIFPRGRALHQKRLVIHPDNCSIHTSRVSRDWLEEYDICHMPHATCHSHPIRLI
jgi:hypothetical protein